MPPHSKKTELGSSDQEASPSAGKNTRVSFLESNSPDILAHCDTNLDDSSDSGNFSARGYLPLIRKDSITQIHGLTVYVKEGLTFTRDLSLENCRFLLLFSTGFT